MKVDSTREWLARQLAHRQTAVEFLMESFSAEQAVLRLHDQGPHARWILSHLTGTARSTWQAIGGPAGNDRSSCESELLPWGTACDEFRATARALRAQWETMELGEEFAPPAIEVLPAFRDKLKTRADFLSGHIFHLAYHAGQLGSLRAKWGLSTP